MTTDIPAPQPAEVTGEGLPVADLLVNMYIRQLTHRKEYDKIYRAKGLLKPCVEEMGNINDPRIQAELREQAGYIIEELMEAINLLKNKAWKQTFRETDPEAFYKELGDAWHFWLEFMIFAGMTPDKVQKYYFQEAAKNDQRRAEGY